MIRLSRYLFGHRLHGKIGKLIKKLPGEEKFNFISFISHRATESSEISMLKKGLSRSALMKGSLKKSMGRPLTDKNKLAYFGRERLPGRPDGDSAGRLQCRAFKRSHQMCNQVFLCEPCPQCFATRGGRVCGLERSRLIGGAGER